MLNYLEQMFSYINNSDNTDPIQLCYNLVNIFARYEPFINNNISEQLRSQQFNSVFNNVSELTDSLGEITHAIGVNQTLPVIETGMVKPVTFDNFLINHDFKPVILYEALLSLRGLLTQMYIGTRGNDAMTQYYKNRLLPIARQVYGFFELLIKEIEYEQQQLKELIERQQQSGE